MPALHPVVCSPVRGPVFSLSYPVRWRSGYGVFFPAGPALPFSPSLGLLWRSASPEVSSVGGAPQYSGSPVVDSGGVAPGQGPDFAAVSGLSGEGSLVVRFTATRASSALSGEELVFGPVYVGPDGLVASIGASRALFPAAWDVGDIVTVVVHVSGGKMRVGGAVFSPSSVYAEGLGLLWRFGKHAASFVGGLPQYSGVPVIDLEGVAPGSGPVFPGFAVLNSQGTLAVRFTATRANADIPGEEHVFGPVCASQAGLVASDGPNKAIFATAWDAGEVVTAVVQMQSGRMRVGRA